MCHSHRAPACMLVHDCVQALTVHALCLFVILLSLTFTSTVCRFVDGCSTGMKLSTKMYTDTVLLPLYSSTGGMEVS